MIGALIRILGSAAIKVNTEVQQQKAQAEEERMKDPDYRAEKNRRYLEEMKERGVGQATRELLLGDDAKVENKDSELSRLLEKGRKAHELKASSKPKTEIKSNTVKLSQSKPKNEVKSYPKLSNEEIQKLKVPAQNGDIDALEALAGNGDVLAQNKLGEQYYLGINTAKNYIKAYEWTLLAANNNNKKAQQRLDILQKYVIGVKTNL